MTCSENEADDELWGRASVTSGACEDEEGVTGVDAGVLEGDSGNETGVEEGVDEGAAEAEPLFGWSPSALRIRWLRL